MAEPLHSDNEPLLEDHSLSDQTFGNVQHHMTLTWENLEVRAPPEKKPLCRRRKYDPIKSEPKTILHSSSGIVHAGSVMAVLGASGSGKTVLLNCLTRRNLGKLEVRGDVRVNGHILGASISKISAYVQQQDAFIGTLKVREHLWFQAQLRLGKHFSEKERSKRVDGVMQELGLAKRADTLIGIPGKMKTLSGGERRRLLFASEILTNPYILFCDEPTTGLDSYMAQSVIQMLRDMALKGRTIICSIHQPASEVYSLFDRLALLADGRMAFLGPTTEVLSCFNGVGLHCPPNYNPADFFIRTLALAPGKEQDHYDTVKRVCDGYGRSVYSEDVLEEINICKKQHQYDDDFFKTLSTTDGGNAAMSHDGYHRSWGMQLRLLSWRAWIQQTRDPVAFKAAFYQMLITGFFVGLIYLNQKNNQKGVQNINGALFMMQMLVAFNTMFAVLSILPGEYTLFQREYQDRMYGTTTYYLSHLLTEIPIYCVFLPAMFLGVTYFLIGLTASVNAYIQSNAAMFVIALYSLGFSHMVSTMTCSVSLSLSILPLIRNILTIFGGYFVNISSVPYVLRPIEFISGFVYSNEILVSNQWQDVSHIGCEYASYESGTSGARCLQDGQEVISSVSFSANHIVADYIYLLSIYAVVEILGYVILYMRARNLRSK